MRKGWQIRFAWRQRLAQTNGRAKIKRMPHVRYPAAHERAYLEFVLTFLLRPAKALVDERIKPKLDEWLREAHPNRRLDAWDEDLVSTIAAMLGILENEVTEEAITTFLARQAIDVNAFSAAEVTRQITESLGIDVLATQPPEVVAKIRTWTTQNVQLIKSINRQYLGRVEGMLMREIEKGTDSRVIAKMLDDEYGIGRRRAALIAEDQTTKFFGTVNRARHEDLGLNRYIWSDVGDARVRPEHKARNGKVFSYDDPPSDGNPGQPARCRCSAYAVIEDLLEDAPQTAARQAQFAGGFQ